MTLTEFLKAMKLTKFAKFVLGIIAVFAAVVLNASAQTDTTNTLTQTNITTVTNIVTITVTNFVTLTNVVLTPPAPAAPAPAAAPVVPAKVVIVAANTTNATVKVVVPPKYPWVSTLTAGTTLTRGNSDSLLITAKLVTDKKTPINEFSFDADTAYGSANGQANTEMVHGFGQWNHLFSERWYSYVRLEGLHDDIAQVRYRATLTSGLGYYLIKQTNTTLAAEVGPGIVIQRVGDVDNSYATLRLAEKFEHKFNKNAARIWENCEFLPQVNQPSDYLINAEVGVESALYKTISLQVYLDDNYNSQPATGLRRNDVKLVSGVTYTF
jgi:putative salt-induced outer membrane protein YdiY